MMRMCSPLLVLLGEGGQLDVDVGDVDGLVVGEGTAVLHLADNAVALHLLYLQLNEAVVHQDAAAGAHLLVEVLVGDGDLGLVAGHVLGVQHELSPLLQGHGALGKGLDADLRALGVQHGGHRAAQGVPDPLEHIQTGQLLLVVAVGKVEAGAVHAAEDEGLEHLLVVHGGTQGADHFRLSHRNTS